MCVINNNHDSLCPVYMPPGAGNLFLIAVRTQDGSGTLFFFPKCPQAQWTRCYIPSLPENK